MDLEIGGFTAFIRWQSKYYWRRTYYAGKSSTLKAVATTAHCAIEGYKSAIETSPPVL
jgi:hypothetical protein